MDATEAEKIYKSLRAQWDSGQMTPEDFTARIAELKYQDNTGTWWAISPADGSWLMWTGSTWVPAFAQQVPVQPQVPATPVYTAPQPAQAAFPVPPSGGAPVPAPAATAQTQTAAQPAVKAGLFSTLAGKLGGAGLACGILSWIRYPYIFGILAVVIGAVAIYKAENRKGKVAIIAILGITVGLVSILLDFFFLDLFAPHILPPLNPPF
jgi:hypothetical protein